jgi:hypothetical protein
MKIRFAAAALFLAMLFSSGCREQKPGEYAVLTGKVFIFNYRIAEASYVVTLAKAQPFADGSMVIASFENPAGGAPIVVRQKIWPQAAKIVLESPAIECVRKDKPYAIVISIVDPAGAQLQKIETTLTSSLDQDVLPDKPLVVGPVYTPNPELGGNPGSKTGEPKNCSP